MWPHIGPNYDYRREVTIMKQPKLGVTLCQGLCLWWKPCKQDSTNLCSYRIMQVEAMFFVIKQLQFHHPFCKRGTLENYSKTNKTRKPTMKWSKYSAFAQRYGRNCTFNHILVGGFNPFENISQIGSFPQVGLKIKHIWNHHLDIVCQCMPAIHFGAKKFEPMIWWALVGLNPVHQTTKHSEKQKHYSSDQLPWRKKTLPSGKRSHSKLEYPPFSNRKYIFISGPSFIAMLVYRSVSIWWKSLATASSSYTLNLPLAQKVKINVLDPTTLIRTTCCLWLHCGIWNGR